MSAYFDTKMGKYDFHKIIVAVLQDYNPNNQKGR
jgi:hypothetical protein